MSFRSNIIAGWVLAALGIALALFIVMDKQFANHRPEKMGYPIEGVVEDAAAGGAAAAPEVPIETLLATADPAKGAEVFKKCASCHTVNQGGANGIGPNLWATVGAPAAEGKGGYAFSDALKAKGGSWTFQALNAWLTNPRAYANGTKMSFAGLANAQDRANVIVYLNSQGSNLPLPAAPAAGAAGPADTETVPGGKANIPEGPNADTAKINPAAPSQDPAAAAEGAKAK